MASTNVPKLGRCHWQSSLCILWYFRWKILQPRNDTPTLTLIRHQTIALHDGFNDESELSAVPDCVSKRRKELPENRVNIVTDLSVSSSLFFFPKQLNMSAADNADTAATTVVDASACYMIVCFLLLHQHHYRCCACRIRCHWCFSATKSSESSFSIVLFFSQGSKNVNTGIIKNIG